MISFVRTSIEIVEKNRLVLDFAKTAEARYAVGRGVQQDIFRAQTEISRLLARLATLEQRKESLQAEINRLLDRPPADPLGTPQRIQVTPLQHNLTDLNALIERVAALAGAVQRRGAG
jgi:outer membrane protein TolC